MINPRAVAALGIGFGPRAVATLGLVAQAVVADVVDDSVFHIGGSGQAKRHRSNREAMLLRDDEEVVLILSAMLRVLH